MGNILQDLHTVGLNPFAVQLLAESLLKSPLAAMTIGKPQGIFFPVTRGDCAGWSGVRITLEAVPTAAMAHEQLAQPGVQSPVAQGGVAGNPVQHQPAATFPVGDGAAVDGTGGAVDVAASINSTPPVAASVTPQVLPSDAPTAVPKPEMHLDALVHAVRSHDAWPVKGGREVALHAAVQIALQQMGLCALGRQDQALDLGNGYALIWRVAPIADDQEGSPA